MHDTLRYQKFYVVHLFVFLQFFLFCLWLFGLGVLYVLRFVVVFECENIMLVMTWNL